jgi:hypothetical protein
MYYRGEGFQSNNTRGTPLAGQKSGFKYEMEPGINFGVRLSKTNSGFSERQFLETGSVVSGYPYDRPGDEVGVDQMRPDP